MTARTFGLVSLCGLAAIAGCSGDDGGPASGVKPDASAGASGAAGTGGEGATGGKGTGGGNASGGSAGAGGKSTGGAATGGGGNRDAGADASTSDGGLGDSRAPDASDGSCTAFSLTATQSSSAMLVVLSGSASMTTMNKWTTAQTSVVRAADAGGFDGTTMGLSVYPSAFTDAPACLCTALGGTTDRTCGGLLPSGVACGVSSTAQVALAAAGTDKSTASQGVRHDLYQFLTSRQPLSSADNGAPMYDTLSGAYAALAASNVARRAVLLIADGGGDCVSVSNPARPGYSDGVCPNWEYPDTVNTRIAQARTDASKPTETFVIGLPGTQSHGEQQGVFTTAPYSMLLALSTYAVSGSPNTVDPTCSKSATFSQAAADPAKPCHADLSQAASFSTDKLASAIQDARQKAFGCVYDLPSAPAGQTIDKALVNVVVTTDGTKALVPRRATATDTCASTPCWDYDTAGRVSLIGAACSAISAAQTVAVSVDVGCKTVKK